MGIGEFEFKKLNYLKYNILINLHLNKIGFISILLNQDYSHNLP